MLVAVLRLGLLRLLRLGLLRPGLLLRLQLWFLWPLWLRLLLLPSKS